MGEVFRATDTRLHRTVAIKILPRDKVADPEQKRRFMQEARAASALNHPNIVTLHDLASDNGADYLVMECVSGHPLDRLITPTGLPLADVISYATQIAAALAAAHAAGVVHRDIKPANVIVTDEGQVKVLDFGLAKLEHIAPGSGADTGTMAPALTEAGMVMGTMAYMSPEQARAEEVDARTDLVFVWSRALRDGDGPSGVLEGARLDGASGRSSADGAAADCAEALGSRPKQPIPEVGGSRRRFEIVSAFHRGEAQSRTLVDGSCGGARGVGRRDGGCLLLAVRSAGWARRVGPVDQLPGFGQPTGALVRWPDAHIRSWA